MYRYLGAVALETLSFTEIRDAFPKTELETAIVRAASQSYMPIRISIQLRFTILTLQPTWSAMCALWPMLAA
jgi:hypothetical protein